MYYNSAMADDQIPPVSRASGLVTVQLGFELKLEWTQWCASRGLVPGKALRSLVERVITDGLELSAGGSNPGVRIVVAEQPDRGAKVGREVQFTPSENAAVEVAAGAQGFAFQEWVIAAVRAALANTPAYGQAELEAMTQSNEHMAQVAIELGALRRQGDAANVVEELDRLERDVRQHVEAVSAAMARGAQRWQLKV